jgi:probable HAF family extracellular repeat protein
MKRRHLRKAAHRLWPFLAAIVIVLQIFATVAFGQASEPSSYTFSTIDVPLPDGQLDFTSLQDINDEGQIAGAFTNSNLGPYGFLLDFNKKKVRSTKIRCRDRDVVSTAPQSINSLGEIAGFASVVVERVQIPEQRRKVPITQIKGFFRDRRGKCTILDFPGANLTEALGVNDGGQVVGDYRDANTGSFHGFLWDAGQFMMIDVPFTGGHSTSPSGINNVGQIVGFYDDNNGRHGFLYSDGTFTSFDFPEAVVTLPFDINDNGQILGIFTTDTGSGSFVLAEDTFRTFDVPFPGVVLTQVSGINNEGQIVGRYAVTNPNDPVNPFPSHGFVASPNVSSPLVASLTEGQSLDPKKPNPVPQPLTDESQKVVTYREAGVQLCFVDDTTPASFAFALSKVGLCATGMTTRGDEARSHHMRLSPSRLP